MSARRGDAMSAGDNCGGGVITGEGNEVTSKSRGQLYSLHVRMLQIKPTRSKHSHRLRTGQPRLSHATDLLTLEFSFPCQGYDASQVRSEVFSLHRQELTGVLCRRFLSTRWQ